MAYSTLSDLQKMLPAVRLAELTADAGDEIDEGVVTEAIAEADAEIDGYLGAVYDLPFGTTPPRVKALSVDIAIYLLYKRRMIAEEVARKRYEDAIRFLERVVDGKAQVVDAAGDEPETEAVHVTEMTGATRVFSRTTLENF